MRTGRLLALPLVEVSNPDEVWRRVWDATSIIREIVEFGDADNEQDAAWRGRSEASWLMRFAFGLGLMMMDSIITPSRELAYDRRETLEGLLRSLADAVNELDAIDQFDRGYWAEAMRHLAVRRAVWLAGKEPSVATLPAFDETTKPTLDDLALASQGTWKAFWRS